MKIKDAVPNVSTELRWLNVVLFFTITLLVIAVLYTNRNFVAINLNFKEMDRANKAIMQIHTLETTIYKTESLVRLFVITQKPDVIVNQYDQKDRVITIRDLTREHPEMRQDIDTLAIRLAERFLLWNAVINLPASTTPAQKNQMIMEGEAATERIMTLTERLKAAEREVVDKNSRDTMSGVRIMTMLVGGSVLFSISLFIFAFFRLTNQIKREALVHIQLQQKNRELDRSNKELEQFAYVASHDLQEPLRKIHTYTGRLAAHEKENLSAEGREIVDKLLGFAHRMQLLIDHLLNFSRMLQHKLEKKEVDLNKILNETLTTMSGQIQASGAVINADILPAVKGYESQLQQLFQNLISNSIKYRRTDVALQISVKTSIVTGREIKDPKANEIARRFYKIVFSDNGIGFGNENAERIFVIFQRLHGRSEYEGTGIGLAICKLVVQNHEGYINATGQEGEGAEFTVYIPIV